MSTRDRQILLPNITDGAEPRIHDEYGNIWIINIRPEEIGRNTPSSLHVANLLRTGHRVVIAPRTSGFDRETGEELSFLVRYRYPLAVLVGPSVKDVAVGRLEDRWSPCTACFPVAALNGSASPYGVGMVLRFSVLSGYSVFLVPRSESILPISRCAASFTHTGSYRSQ